MSLVDAIDSYNAPYDLDTEELLVRSLQIPGMTAAIPPFTPVSKGLADLPSSIASLEQTKAKTVPLFRPKLEEPSQNAMIGVIDAHMRTEELARRQTTLFAVSAKELQARVEELDREKIEEIERQAKAQQTRETWGVFSTVLRYIASAASIVLALAVGRGSTSGKLLLAAGGLGLFNNIMQDTKGWEAIVAWGTKSHELQTSLAQKIEMGMLLLTLGLGLAGGVIGHQTGALAAAYQGSSYKQVGQAVALAGGVMGATAKVGMAVTDKKIADLQARLKELEMEIATSNQTKTQEAKRIESLLDSVQSMAEEASKSIRAYEVQQD